MHLHDTSEHNHKLEDKPLLQQILSRDNMERAFKRVTSNKGAAGVDGVETTDLRAVLNERWPRIKSEILEGSYKPQPVHRVEIDKPGGGTRPLGIPITTDRLIQQAIQQVLGPACEPVFSPHSYGFRSGKSVSLDDTNYQGHLIKVIPKVEFAGNKRAGIQYSI